MKIDSKIQDKKHHLAYLDGKTSKFQLKPDIVINKGEIIADTKWKLLSEDKTHQGISQSDMYQLYAYGTKYKDCKYMYLIYPYDGLEIQNSYQYFRNDEEKKLKDELHLNVLFFDVSLDKPCFKNEIYRNDKKYKIFEKEIN